ncbi:MAG TPA: hypothetical protein VGO00_24035 [Kofleriaceae bacterium]|nr:hypothetical protein [Kofleriaceae bacterium]
MRAIRAVMMHSEESLTQISKQSANVWWSEHLGRPIPAQVPPQAYFQPPVIDPPHAALAMILAVLGLLFTPFAIAAWILAGHELRRIEAGSASKHGAGWLVVAKAMGVVVTLFAVTMLAGLLITMR